MEEKKMSSVLSESCEIMSDVNEFMEGDGIGIFQLKNQEEQENAYKSNYWMRANKGCHANSNKVEEIFSE